ncbi:MAG: MGH1-like glycoside hydrolase domain-containing protein, partial [Chitinophagaceae bacterium]
GEDGIAGLTDYFQNLCFAVALWNGKDPILKERLFGLGNSEGNHGEDVKELYYYLDNVPTHYYMEYLYKYPQNAYPYNDLVETNRRRSKLEPEYEILDTGVFDNNAYFDVHVTYAKQGSQDIFIKITITNHFNEAAPIWLLPTIWFYNRWKNGEDAKKPVISAIDKNAVKAEHERLGKYYFYYQKADDAWFTDNETNKEKALGQPNSSPFVKDAFHKALIKGEHVAELRNRKKGTKFSPVYSLNIPAKSSKTIYCRLSNKHFDNAFTTGFEEIFALRKQQANDFYEEIIASSASSDWQNIQRQAFAGLLWSKQFYQYDVERWLSTSDGITPVNDGKLKGRNHDWTHLKNQDIILMPDKWEYPWYAAWDLAFHCIPMAMIDATFAKHQLLLIMREWYMKPDGQLPAYEWNFGDVNPPVHAWAALQVYKIDKELNGKPDLIFLKRIFQKLIINFTWWINRKDSNNNNIFEGGFLGLDNIGVFNRSLNLADHLKLEQADGTSWMGKYALNMMDIALEIATHDISFEDTATKFFEHFVLIAEAMNSHVLWNEEDQFFYDTLHVADGSNIPLKIQSIVGLSPLLAVSVISKNTLSKLPDFKKRITWFENYRKKNNRFWPNEERSDSDQILLSLVPKEKLVSLLKRMLNEEEFLSEGGIRALSKYHEANPYSVNIEGQVYSIQYDPGDSTSDLFGGNSNWRGPVWLPMNYLFIRSIRKYGAFYGDTLQVECPTNSGNWMTLREVADELTLRVISLFNADEVGKRRYNDTYSWFYEKPENKDLLLFFEYFHGDSGKGLGASHQTGWTAVVADLIHQMEKDKPQKPKRQLAILDEEEDDIA